jgi:predicted amino acid-binding ACT domain protein
MALNVRTVEYFYVRIANDHDDAYRILAQLAEEDINLLAFSAVPFGEKHVEFTLFPEDSEVLRQAGARRGWSLAGPQHAVLIQGDDHLGATADIHKCLSEAGVAIYASSGVTDGAGHFGYVIYCREDDHLEAARALAAAAIRT